MAARKVTVLITAEVWLEMGEKVSETNILGGTYVLLTNEHEVQAYVQSVKVVK